MLLMRVRFLPICIFYLMYTNGFSHVLNMAGETSYIRFYHSSVK